MADLRELKITDIPDPIRGDVEILREYCVHNESAWLALCNVMRALAAQPTHLSRNDAFNLADTVADHYACGRPEEARQAIMAMAAQPATAPDGWREVLKRAREGLGAGGALGVPGSRQRELEVEIGGMLLDHVEDGMERLAAAPSPAAVKDSLTAEQPDHSVDVNKMVTEANACPKCGATNADEAGRLCQPSGDDCPGVGMWPEAQAGADDDARLYAMFRALVDAGGPETIQRHGAIGVADFAQRVRAGMLVIERRAHPERFAGENFPAGAPKPAEGGAVVAWITDRPNAKNDGITRNKALADAWKNEGWNVTELAPAGSGEAVALAEIVCCGESPVFPGKLLYDVRKIPDESHRLEDLGAGTKLYAGAPPAAGKGEARRDAERYRWIRKHRPVLLITGFFGDGCVNKTVEMVDSAIDSAMGGSIEGKS